MKKLTLALGLIMAIAFGSYAQSQTQVGGAEIKFEETTHDFGKLKQYGNATTEFVFKNTGNRAVTKYDYIAITKRHPLVAEADAWGGEEESPVEIGNIWISCTPADHNVPLVDYRDGYKVDILGNIEMP